MTENLVLTPQQIIRKKAAGEPIQPDDNEEKQSHTIIVLVENTIGAFIRVINMFSARGFNIDSVTVGPTEDPKISRMNIVTAGNGRIISQVLRQLSRLVDTLEVIDLTGTDFVERELCLLKVCYTRDSRSEILDVNDIFRGKVVDITSQTMTFELRGPSKKIDAFIDMMDVHKIVEVARSGRVAMQRDFSDDHSKVELD